VQFWGRYSLVEYSDAIQAGNRAVDCANIAVITTAECSRWILATNTVNSLGIYELLLTALSLPAAEPSESSQYIGWWRHSIYGHDTIAILWV